MDSMTHLIETVPEKHITRGKDGQPIAVAHEHFLFQRLRNPEYVHYYLLACQKEGNLLGDALCDVIQANIDRPLVALLLLPRFVQYLQRDDIAQILETVQQALPADTPAVSKLTAVLQAVDSILTQGLTVQLAGADQLLSDDAPEYAAWKQIAA